MSSRYTFGPSTTTEEHVIKKFTMMGYAEQSSAEALANDVYGGENPSVFRITVIVEDITKENDSCLTTT